MRASFPGYAALTARCIQERTRACRRPRFSNTFRAGGSSRASWIRDQYLVDIAGISAVVYDVAEFGGSERRAVRDRATLAREEAVEAQQREPLRAAVPEQV